MAIRTFSVAVSASWTPLADGAVYKTVGVVGDGSCLLAINGTTPPADSEDYFRCPADGFSVNLLPGDILYARISSGRQIVRGYRVGV